MNLILTILVFNERHNAFVFIKSALLDTAEQFEGFKTVRLQYHKTFPHVIPMNNGLLKFFV